jgi:hypothetical protein
MLVMSAQSALILSSNVSTLDCKEASEVIILSSLDDTSTHREQGTPDVCLKPCKSRVWATAPFVVLLGAAAIGLLGDGTVVVGEIFLKASNSSLETETIIYIFEKLILQVYFTNQRFISMRLDHHRQI